MDTSGKLYQIFTVTGGEVRRGVAVERIALRSGKGFFPGVSLASGENISVGLHPRLYKQWAENKHEVYLLATYLTWTRGDRRRLQAPTEWPVNFDHVDPDMAVVIFRTPHPENGACDHAGAFLGWECQECGNADFVDPPRTCPNCGAGFTPTGFSGLHFECRELPGQILIGGEGSDWRQDQLIGLIPHNHIVTVHSFSFDGKGPTTVYFYNWDRQDLRVLSQAEGMNASVEEDRRADLGDLGTEIDELDYRLDEDAILNL